MLARFPCYFHNFVLVALKTTKILALDLRKRHVESAEVIKIYNCKVVPTYRTMVERKQSRSVHLSTADWEMKKTSTDLRGLAALPVTWC